MGFVNYLNLYHKDTATNFEFSSKFLLDYAEKFMADFVIIYGSITVCDLINFYYSKEETKSTFKIILKRIIFQMIVCAIFFMIFNSPLADICYNLLFDNL